jgi:peroxiredoxin
MNDTAEKPQDSRSRKFRSLLFNGVLILAVFILVTTFQSRNMLATGGQVAPELRGTTLEGEYYDLEGAGSRPALVYFFAPWCKICAASADNLNRLRRWRSETDLEMVAVALDWGDVEEVRDYVQSHELDIPIVLGDSNVARQWQIYAFPSYYVLDSEHRIARRDIGYSSQLGLLWRALTVDWH